MSMGLALDTRGVGSPDELMNRPLVWAYFVVAAWTSAVGYRLVIGTALPRGRQAAAAMAVLVLCAGLALHSAPNLQTFPERDKRASFVESASVPNCLVQAASWLRRHSAPGDVVQDAGADPDLILAGLGERQLYVGNNVFGGTSPVQRARLSDVAQLAQVRDAGQVQQFFTARHIDWYLQAPATPLAWPKDGLPSPSFSCGGFRLIHFVRPAAAPAALANQARAAPGGQG